MGAEQGEEDCKMSFCLWRHDLPYMVVLRIFVRFLYICEPRKINLLLFQATQSMVDWLKTSIMSWCHFPHNYTKWGKGKKISFESSGVNCPIQNTLGHLFYIDSCSPKIYPFSLSSLLSKEISTGNISEVLSRKILTESGWTQVCVSCFCHHSHPSFCPGCKHKQSWENCIFGSHPMGWNSIYSLEWGESQN